MLFIQVVSGANNNGGRFYREAWGKGEYAFAVNGDAIKQTINELYGNAGKDALDVNSFLMRKNAEGELEVYVPTLDDYMAADWKVAIKPSSYK